VTDRLRRVVVVASLMAALLTGWPLGRVPAHASHNNRPCTADPRGGGDPKAQIKFTAIPSDRGQTVGGHQFDYGAVHDLVIEVRWEKMKVPARQRLELYAPDGNLFQMFTDNLTAEPDPVELRVPVIGSWIMSASLAGQWCAKVFLNNDLAPVAADGFELRFKRR
jgi:hypothetical protein